MQRTDPSPIAVAILLAGLAGFVDALAFTSMGGYFAAFMSGNSTRFGAGIGSGAFAEARVAGALVLSFVSGVILGSVILRAAPRRPQAAVMAAAAALLVAAAGMQSYAPGPIVLLLLAAAMGVENAVFARGRDATIGIAHVTGLLARMAERLAGALMGDSDRWGWVPFLLLWIGVVAGVVLGALAYLRLGGDAYWIAAAAAAALALWFGTIGNGTKPQP